MPEVSVIMPVYNVAPYLRQCLDSLKAQTLKDIEVICVDDGSTDGSSTILDEYAAADSRFRVIRQPNAGAGTARNRGLEEARGTYLFFCDADDWCGRTLLACASATAERTGADIVLFDCMCVYEDVGKATPRLTTGTVRNRSRPFAPTEIAPQLFQAVTAVPWNKVFRRSFVLETGVKFQPLPRNNDVFFSFACSAVAGSIAVVRRKLYWHRGRREGSLHSNFGVNPFSFYEAKESVFAYLKERGLYDSFRGSLAYSIYAEAMRLLFRYEEGPVFRDAYGQLRKRLTECPEYGGLDAFIPKDRGFVIEYRDVLECADPDEFLLRVVRRKKPVYVMAGVRMALKAAIQRRLGFLFGGVNNDSP